MKWIIGLYDVFTNVSYDKDIKVEYVVYHVGSIGVNMQWYGSLWSIYLQGATSRLVITFGISSLDHCEYLH